MPPKPSITLTERRARLGIRHHLAASARANTAVEVARNLVAFHGTDPASVYLSAAARVNTPSIADMETALYVERQLVRMLGMRRTMFVVNDAMAPVVHSACTAAIAIRLKRQYQQLLAQAGVVQNVPVWWAEVETQTLAALEKLGEATAQELGKHVPLLKTQIRLAEGKDYAGTQSVATWMLNELAAEGRIVRGRPLGSWISSQYRWALIERWLPDGLTAVPTADAQVELISGWLRAFGPGTLEDLKWWSGLTMGEVKRAVAALDVTEVDLGELTGVVLQDDVESKSEPEPWVALLPALDVTPMAYARRDWFLGPHGPRLFDRSGNIGPTIWSEGRIVGGWAQRADGAVAYKTLEDVGREGEVHIQSAAHSLEAWLRPTRVTPRFRTPLERELSA